MPPIQIDAQIPAAGCRFFGSFPPGFGPLGGLQAHSSLRSHQTAPRHPQVGQREQRVQLRGVLGQSAVAHLHMSKLALDHPKRVFDLGPDAGLDAFQLFDELLDVTHERKVIKPEPNLQVRS